MSAVVTLRYLAVLALAGAATTAWTQSASVAPCPLQQYRVPAWAGDRSAFRQQLEADVKLGYQGGDADLALAALCAGAAAGEPFAEMALAMMIAEGKLGLSKDLTQARHWLRRAASRGDAQAQYLLSNIYMAGKGGPVQIREGISLLRSAARGGNADAQFMLGAELITGDHIQRDFDAAEYWLQRAQRSGHQRAAKVLNDLRRERRRR